MKGVEVIVNDGLWRCFVPAKLASMGINIDAAIQHALNLYYETSPLACPPARRVVGQYHKDFSLEDTVVIWKEKKP